MSENVGKGIILRRNGMVDLYRFGFILLIMAHHLYLADKPFNSAWIYVEFFFILSGYYTMKHYANISKELPLDQKASEAIRYTVFKFGRIVPYAFAAVLLEYIITFSQNGVEGKKAFVGIIQELMVEVMLLTSSGLGNAYLAPIWYLSAMFLVFPFLCMLLSYGKMHKFYCGYLAWILPVLYYGKIGVICERAWPHDMIRAFVCLWLGVFVYGLCQWLGTLPETRWIDILITLGELGAFGMTIICTAWNTGYTVLIVICFVIGSVCVLSERSFTKYVKSIPDLGKFSMILYLFHWPVKHLISICFTEGGGQVQRIILYYTVSIIISICVLICGKGVKIGLYMLSEADIYR